MKKTLLLVLKRRFNSVAAALGWTVDTTSITADDTTATADGST